MAQTNVQAFSGDVEIAEGLTVFRDIESSNSFITERVLFRETWPNGLNSLAGDLGTWVVANLNQQGNPGVETTPDGYGIVAFNGNGAYDHGTFTSPAFDLSDYAIVDGILQEDDKRKTTTRVFMKFWLGTKQLDGNNDIIQVQFSPDNGTTWYTVATSQDRTELNRFTMVSADLSPYILSTGTPPQAKIRFYMPWNNIGQGDYMRIGRIWIHESDVPTNLGGMWLGAGGNIGIGTTTPVGQLEVHGEGQATTTSFNQSGNLGGILTVKSSNGSAGDGGGIMFGANQGYFAAIKGTLSDGADNTSGELRFCTRNPPSSSTMQVNMVIDRSGNVGIGTANPSDALHVYGSPIIQHSSTDSSTTDSTWYIVGTWDATGLDAAQKGGNLYLTFLGGQLFGSNPAGKSEIFANVGNGSAYRSIFWKVDGEKIFSDVRMRRVSTNNYKYDICVRMRYYTNHTMRAECSRTTSFERKFTSTSEPSSTDTTNVELGIILPSADINGSLGIGTIYPEAKLAISSPTTNGASLQIKNKLTAAAEQGASYAYTTLRQKPNIGGNDRALQIESYPYGGAGQNIMTWLAWNSTNNGWLTPMSLTNSGNLTLSGIMRADTSTARQNFYFADSIGSDGAWRTAFSVGSTAIGFFSVLSYNAGFSQVNAIWYYQYKSGGTSGGVTRISGSSSPDFRMSGQTVQHNGNGATHFTQIRVLPFVI